MSMDSPVAILFDVNGVEMAVVDGVAIPIGTMALLLAGTDGGVARLLEADAAGRVSVGGGGVAGTPAGGVLTIQGDPAGTPMPVSGSVTATNASIGLTGAAVPASATFIGAKVGANLVAPEGATAAPAGTEVGLIVRNIPSGTQAISATSLPLPTGAATEVTLSSINTKTPALGQALMAASVPVTLASNQTPIAVSVPDATTPALSNVAASVTSVTLLASNTGRLGATLYNDSAQPCYVKFGATASTTSFTVRLSTQSYYEVPFGYTGVIDGIWPTAVGSMRVTELTP